MMMMRTMRLVMMLMMVMDVFVLAIIGHWNEATGDFSQLLQSLQSRTEIMKEVELALYNH